jgi:hypothetical protein
MQQQEKRNRDVSTEIMERVQKAAETRTPPARRPLPEVRKRNPLPRQTAANPVIAINEGSIFVTTGLVSPAVLKSRSFTEGWSLVEGKRAPEIERDLQGEGWHFFYLIPDVQGAGIARSPDRALRKALEKVFAKALVNRVNTLEIASVRTRSVLGVYRAEVVAKLRHIQESPYLFTTVEEMQQRTLRVKPAFRTIRLRRWHLGQDYREYKPL